MIPGYYNIRAYRNDTLQRTFTIVDANDNPISLANADVKMQIRKQPDSAVLMELTEGNGLTVSGGGNNVINLSKVIDIDECGNYMYDLQATFTSGVVSTYVAGSFNVIKDITHV